MHTLKGHGQGQRNCGGRSSLEVVNVNEEILSDHMKLQDGHVRAWRRRWMSDNLALNGGWLAANGAANMLRNNVCDGSLTVVLMQREPNSAVTFSTQARVRWEVSETLSVVKQRSATGSKMAALQQRRVPVRRRRTFTNLINIPA
jgi:uncharacterized protein YhdP